MTDATPLLQPTTFGAIPAANRVLMAPLTRNRALEGRTVGDLHAEYYRQRAGMGLIVTEATVVSAQGVGYVDTPGLYTDAQTESWKAVTDAVHDEGGSIVAQLWHVGRVSHTDFHDGEPPVAPTAAAAETMTFTTDGFVPTSTPRALATDELPGLVQTFVDATRRAREAGFDGVEVHGANGYLLEQFLSSDVNTRDDAYGGPAIEDRARLLLEVVDAVVGEWSADRVGIRLSLGNGTAGATEPDPAPMLRYLGGQLQARGLAYVHLIENPAEDTGLTRFGQSGAMRDGGWTGPVILNGGHDLDSGVDAVASGKADAIAYGRLAIANPDLVARFAKGAELNEPDGDTFYGGDEKGYTDYPFLGE